MSPALSSEARTPGGHAVVLVNGFPPTRGHLNHALKGASLFVCADGGADAALALRRTPDAIVGDFDSVTPEALRGLAGVPQFRDPDPGRTDLEKSLDFILARVAVPEIRVLGATRGRLDHVLGHISVMHRYLGRNTIILEDDHGRAFLARDEVRLEARPGTLVSFFAVGQPVPGLATEGLEYALQDVTLQMGVQDSVSNVIKKNPAWIRFPGGVILVVLGRTAA